MANSWSWTGRGEPDVKDRIAEINKAVEQTRVRGEAAKHVDPAPKPPYVPIKYTPTPAKIESFSAEQLQEYIDIAETVGVAPPDLIVEEFKTYLRGKDFPVFDLTTVVKFMDAKSKAEGKGWGWHWVPLRDKDRIDVRFGRAATRREVNRWVAAGEPSFIGEDRPASDHYSPSTHLGMGVVTQTETYNKVVPLHALKKVAMIEKEFRHNVAFMVSDYAPAPAFKADPFLMVVVKNNFLHEGQGRFVIDVWDEPGFGIEQMLKSGL